MTTEYSISVDWSEEMDKWENHGRNAIEENCTHKTQDKNSTEENRETNMRYSGYCEECGFHEDTAIPMMNYAYPLSFEPDDEKILEVVKKTNLTVMEKESSGEYFLALTGGGMDLSQDVALAYMIAQGSIPFALVNNVSTQPELSVGGSDWLKVARRIKKELRFEIRNSKESLKKWNEAVKQFKEKKKVERV